MQLPALAAAPLEAPELARAALDQPPAPLSDVAHFLGAPAVELEASPLSARIAIAGANEGRCFVHHEHRLAPLLAEETRPEVEVGLGEDPTPEDWRDGVLHVPKYFSAFLEAPLPSFHPSHRAKWRPHELLHKLARFAWRPDITRFEAYLTARISELLPVVHWYGFDEIGRHTCPEHRGHRPGRTHCQRCEASLVPYWEADTTLQAASAAAEHALEHLATELDACRRELETGRVVATPRPGLDASSDAIGYLRAHWNRITAWSFGAWVERFGVVGTDRFETCEEHLAHVQTLADTLVTQPQSLRPTSERIIARDRNAASDLGYRLLLHIEALDSDTAEDTLMPSIDALAEGAPLQSVLVEVGQRLRALDPSTADRTLAGGWPWLPCAEGTRRSIEAGVLTALPRTLEDEDVTSLVAAFVELDRTPRPVALARRAAEHLAQAGDHRASGAVLEAWLRDPPGSDLEAERFGSLPETAGQDGATRLNTTIRRHSTDRTTLDKILGSHSEGPAMVELVAIRWNGEPRVLECTPEVQAALELAASGSVPTGEEGELLLDRGFVVWLPPAR